jgi:hypothetical protein
MGGRSGHFRGVPCRFCETQGTSLPPCTLHFWSKTASSMLYAMLLPTLRWPHSWQAWAIREVQALCRVAFLGGPHPFSVSF